MVNFRCKYLEIDKDARVFCTISPRTDINGKEVFPECLNCSNLELKPPIKDLPTSIDGKFDHGKPDWSMLDLSLIEEIVKVYDFGARKYSRDSWKKLEGGRARYFAALMRHAKELQQGKAYDEESGLLTAAHLAWNAIALIYFTRGGE